MFSKGLDLLKGSSQQLCVNLNGVSVSSGVLAKSPWNGRRTDMARWKLMTPHYLNVEGETWEYTENDRQTGR